MGPFVIAKRNHADISATLKRFKCRKMLELTVSSCTLWHQFRKQTLGCTLVYRYFGGKGVHLKLRNNTFRVQQGVPR